MDLAMQLIFTPMILRLMERRTRPPTLAPMIPVPPGTVVLPYRSPGRYDVYS